MRSKLAECPLSSRRLIQLQLFPIQNQSEESHHPDPSQLVKSLQDHCPLSPPILHSGPHLSLISKNLSPVTRFLLFRRDEGAHFGTSPLRTVAPETACRHCSQAAQGVTTEGVRRAPLDEAEAGLRRRKRGDE